MSIETWTAERIEQLRNFVVSGLTCSQIAAEIGVTRNAVIGKIHRLGLSPARPAGAPARSSPPRARSPRFSPQSRPLSLDRRAVALHRRRRRRTGADRQRTALLAARDRAGQVPLADRRSALPRILPFAATRRLPDSHTARATPAWPIASRRGGVPSDRSTAATPTSRCTAQIRRKSAFCRLAAAHSPAGFFLLAV